TPARLTRWRLPPLFVPRTRVPADRTVPSRVAPVPFRTSWLPKWALPLTVSVPPVISKRALEVRLATAVAAAEYVTGALTLGRLMTTSSAAAGRMPPSQLLARLQAPPAGLVNVRVASSQRSSSDSIKSWQPGRLRGRSGRRERDELASRSKRRRSEGKN